MESQDRMTLDVARAIWRARLFVKDPEANAADFHADWKRTRKHYIRVADRMLANLNAKGYALIEIPGRKRRSPASDADGSDAAGLT